MYIVDYNTAPGTIREFSMSIPWDISTKSGAETASHAMLNTDHAFESWGIWFNALGTKAIVSGDNQWAEYSFSTGFDVTSATFVQVVTGTGGTDHPSALSFSQDGTKAYRTRRNFSQTQGWVSAYNVGTPWDVSTISLLSEMEVTAEVGALVLYGVSINNDGTKMFLFRNSDAETTGSSNMVEYALSVPYNPTSATFVSEKLFVESKYLSYPIWSPTGTDLTAVAIGGTYDLFSYTSTAVSIGGLTTKLYHDGIERLVTGSLGVTVNGSIDFTGAEAQVALPNFATASLPLTPIEGGLVFDTDLQKAKVYGGSPAGWSKLGGLDAVVEDLSPQLGANLDTNGFNIVSADGTSPSDIRIQPGTDTDGGTGADVTIASGYSTTAGGVGGSLNLFAGDGDTTGGEVFMFGGYSTTGTAGGITIDGGYVGTNGGDVFIKGGYSPTGTSGKLTLNSGATSTGIVGDIIIETGDSNSTLVGGDIKLICIQTLQAGSAGGSIDITAGYGVASGGAITIKPGGTGTGNASKLDLFAADSSDVAGLGGDITLTPGYGGNNADPSLSGTVEIHAGRRQVSVGKLDFWRDTNTLHTTGNYVRLQAPTTLAADRTWTLPDDDPATSNGYFLKTDATGVLSFASVATPTGFITLPDREARPATDMNSDIDSPLTKSGLYIIATASNLPFGITNGILVNWAENSNTHYQTLYDNVTNSVNNIYTRRYYFDADLVGNTWSPWVKQSHSALEINTQTGTTYTLVATDMGDLVTMDNASANTLTIPTNASVEFPIGTQILVEQEGAGTTTISGGTGSPPAVTVHSAGDLFDFASQYTTITMIKKATDTWLIVGDLV